MCSRVLAALSSVQGVDVYLTVGRFTCVRDMTCLLPSVQVLVAGLPEAAKHARMQTQLA